jgi:hypothetical protein
MTASVGGSQAAASTTGVIAKDVADTAEEGKRGGCCGGILRWSAAGVAEEASAYIAALLEVPEPHIQECVYGCM